MRILITGGCGFIGSHIADALSDCGHKLTIIDNLSTGRLENLNKNAVFYEKDILRDDISYIFEKEKPEAVYHEAAQIKVQKSLEDPASDADSNIMASVRLFSLCEKYNVKKVIYASTAAVYGNPDYLPVDEAHPINPMSFYGLSKYIPENYLRLYSELYGLKYTVLRYANVYGPRQAPDGEGGVVSVFASKLSNGKEPVIFGSGEQTRDFIYVKDIAAANAAVLDRGDNMTFNVSSNSPVSINELSDKMKSAYGIKINSIYKNEQKGDILHSVLNNSLLIKETGWKSKYGLEEGILETIREIR